MRPGSCLKPNVGDLNFAFERKVHHVDEKRWPIWLSDEASQVRPHTGAWSRWVCLGPAAKLGRNFGGHVTDRLEYRVGAQVRWHCVEWSGLYDDGEDPAIGVRPLFLRESQLSERVTTEPH